MASEASKERVKRTEQRLQRVASFLDRRATYSVSCLDGIREAFIEEGTAGELMSFPRDSRWQTFKIKFERSATGRERFRTHRRYWTRLLRYIGRWKTPKRACEFAVVG